MNQFFIHYLQYSHILIFAFCFYLFEKLYKKSLSTRLFFFIFLLIGGLIGYTYTNIDLLVLFVLIFTFSYMRFPQENLMQIVLSLMLSASIEIVVTRLYVEIYYYASKFENESNVNFALLFTAVMSFIISGGITVLLRNRLYPLLKRENKLNNFAFVMLLIVLSHQTFRMIQNYAENQNLFFLLVIFYLVVVVLIVTILRALSRNALLETTAKNDKTIADLQKQYVYEVKKQYQETRKFRHDYVNLLSTIHYYLANDKISELKEFFFNDIMKTSANLKESNLILDALQNIESLGIRSILYTKLLLAEENQINVQVEIKEFLPEEKNVDTISLVRLFGIFLDNAIEELKAIQTGVLTVVAFEENEDLVFIIQNTTRENVEPLQFLKKEGFSTRGENRGIGLFNAEEILLSEPNLLLETKVVDNLFIQRITILSEVK